VRLTSQHLLDALSTVIDPDFKKDLVSLQMIRDIEIAGDRVKFRLVLTTPSCPMKDFLRNSCLRAIAEKLGEHIEVEIKMDAEVTSRVEKQEWLPGVKNTIAVVAGKGGVGKSTVAANLSLALQQSGAKIGLLDADIYGPSVPVMFGLKKAKPAVKKEGEKFKILPIEKFGIKLLSIGFLIDEAQAVVWRGPMVSSAIKQFISDCDWGELDYLIIDLPPGTGDVLLTLSQLIALTGAVVVTTPQDVAIEDVRKAVSMLQLPQINVPILGVVENMSWFSPAELPDNKYFIFGNGGGKLLAEELGVPLLAQLPLLLGIREGGDAGMPGIVRMNIDEQIWLRQMGDNIARQIAIRNAGLLPDLAVQANYILS